MQKNKTHIIKNKKLRGLAFAGTYGLLVCVLSFFLAYLPLGLSLENQLYDRVQQYFVIDSQSDYLYDRYEKYLDQFCFINLDASLIDAETDRVNKKQLTRLLNRLAPNQEECTSIFLDYAMENISEEDQNLVGALSEISSMLVMPMSFKVKGDMSLAGENSLLTLQRIEDIHTPDFKDGQIGYTQYFTDPVGFSNRYFKYYFNDASYNSIPWVLYQKKMSLHPTEARDPGGEMKEIRFLLRNKPQVGEEPAVYIYDAKNIINGSMPSEVLAQEMKNKQIIIGLFDNYLTKYNQPIDKFITPVEAEMSGPLLIVNAYLNLQTGQYIRSNAMWVLFILNFFIGCYIAFFHSTDKFQILRTHPLMFVISNIVASLLFFNMAGIFIFIMWNTKLVMGISLLLFQYHGVLFKYFETLLQKKQTYEKVIA